MCLIANSSPVAYGGLGNPVRTLVAVTGLPEADFSAMLGRILPLTTLVLPFWLIRVLCNRRDTMAVWPGLLACGVIFGGIQFFWSNFMGAALVDILAGIGTLLLLAVFFQSSGARRVWRYDGRGRGAKKRTEQLTFGKILLAWSAVPVAGRLRGALGHAGGDQVPGYGVVEAAGAGPAHAW